MGRVFVIGLSCLFMLGSCTGDQGAQGSSGQDGADGMDGADGADGMDGQGVELGYVGSDTCGTAECHAQQYASWTNTGHPYKIVPKQAILDGTGYPEWIRTQVHGEEFAVDADFFDAGQGGAQVLSVNANTFPNGGWDDVSYVIGGYGWKARFIGVDGYIITGSSNTADPDDDDKVQYNPPLEVDAFGSAAYPTSQ